MARYFTLDEANAALALVEPLLRQVVALKASYSQAEGELQGTAQRIALAGGAQVDPAQLLRARGRRDAAAARLKELIEEVQTHGCFVKDLDLGLVDFPALYRGEEVYLCFRLGEERIGYWHGVDEGFRGRKEIDEDFLANHGGGRRH